MAGFARGTKCGDTKGNGLGMEIDSSCSPGVFGFWDEEYFWLG